MASSAITSATTTLSISTSMPATYTETGFEALSAASWIKIGEISNMGQVGGTTTVVSHIPVDTAVVVKRAGSQNFGQMQISMARHTGTDVDAIRAAFADRLPRSFRIAYPTVLNSSDYFTAIVTSSPTMIGTADEILMMQFTLEVDNTIIYATNT